MNKNMYRPELEFKWTEEVIRKSNENQGDELIGSFGSEEALTNKCAWYEYDSSNNTNTVTRID